MHILVAHPLYDWSVEAQQLGELFLRAVLPLLGVAGSVGHEVVIDVESAILGREEPHVRHSLLHLVEFQK